MSMLLCCGGKDDSTNNPPVPTGKPKIYLAGDSLCAFSGESKRPKWGWGEKFPEFVQGCTVVNKAVGGTSTKTFREKGNWGKLVALLKKDDVVLIQFGHNDEDTDPEKARGTTPDEYYSNLCQFIREVKNKGAVPVILTSVCRLQFKDGEPVHSHKTYPEKAKQAASDNSVVALDIEQLSWDWLNDLGYDNAKLRYMISTEGSTDTTHLNELGATEIAQITANALKACGNPDLAKLAK